MIHSTVRSLLRRRSFISIRRPPHLRRYETVFILRPDLGEAPIKETVKRFEGIVTACSGEMIETDEWGFRELAYRIKGERRGFYVRLDYAAGAAVMNEVERNLRLLD